MKIKSLRTSLILAFTISFITNAMLFLAFYYIRNNLAPPPNAPEGKHEIELIDFVYRFIVNFIISFSVGFIFFKISELLPKKKMRIVIIVVLSFIATIVISYIFTKVSVLFHSAENDTAFFFRNMIRDLFIALVTVFSAQIMLLSRKQQQSAVENQKLLAESMQSRYQALKNQIDPHFLFNSLNTLNALIKSDPEKAQEYVLQLSHVFRYILQQETIINVVNELDFTFAYCSLMKIRYGDNLEFDFMIDPDYEEYKIIPLSLQLLVENAIKHNIITAKQPLTVTVYSDENNGITVSNKIQPKKDVTTGTGIGLSNLSERYRLLTKKEIEISNTEVYFSVRIPIFKTI